jgi:hypothetical protein
MLEKLIEVLENGTVQVRTVVVDGETTSFKHYTIAPGADYSKEEPRLKAICAAVQTPDVIAAYAVAQSA